MDYRHVFFSSSRRHTSYIGDWSSDVCSSDLDQGFTRRRAHAARLNQVDPILDQGRGDQVGTAAIGGEFNSFNWHARAVQLEIGRASCRERAASTATSVAEDENTNTAR